MSDEPTPLSRRDALVRLSLAAGAGALLASRRPANAQSLVLYRTINNRINQSVVRWCFDDLSLEELAKHASGMGIKSVELQQPAEWPKIKEFGLTCAISSSHGFTKGFANRDEHEECLANLRERIPQCADEGVPSIITFSGMDRGVDHDEARRNMVDGLKAIAPDAEKAGVTVCVEMLNSRVDVTMKGHPGYWLDDMDETIAILKEVGSERVKVLFDIYHVQIMHGDVITRIREYHPYIGHYHTAGVPGRNEIDDSQEINYPAIMKEIVATGYKGYVGQEFMPTKNPVIALNEAVALCDV